MYPLNGAPLPHSRSARFDVMRVSACLAVILLYLAHPIVVELLRYGYFLAVPILLRPPYYMPVTFFVTCLLTFGLVALMQRVPGLQRIV